MLLTMVMVADIVLELGFGVLGAPSTHRPFCCAPRAVHTEAATAGCVHCVALGPTRWWSCMLNARLAWMVDWAAVHIELGRAELVRPYAHSLLVAHGCVKERLGWTFDVALCSTKDIGRRSVAVQEQRFVISRSRCAQAIDFTVEGPLRVDGCAKTQLPDLALRGESPQRVPVL